MKIETEIKWLVDNWDNVPDDFKQDIHGNGYGCKSGEVNGLKKEEHMVILILDRQKPSVTASYSFDEERIGVNRAGKIIWGFDSGCSCPSPWMDTYPECYNVDKEWKQFVLKDTTGFDEDWEKECLAMIAKIKESINDKS